MAYKALNMKVCEEINLDKDDWNNAFQAACTVFFIQVMMVILVATTMSELVYPNNVMTLAARFITSLLMQLQVEGDIRQGMMMMKYTVNHYADFRFPGVSFLVGFMQFTGGLSAEILCILFTST